MVVKQGSAQWVVTGVNTMLDVWEIVLLPFPRCSTGGTIFHSPDGSTGGTIFQYVWPQVEIHTIFSNYLTLSFNKIATCNPIECKTSLLMCTNKILKHPSPFCKHEMGKNIHPGMNISAPWRPLFRYNWFCSNCLQSSQVRLSGLHNNYSNLP